MSSDPSASTSERADIWLWSVRLFKTRALAAEVCRNGKITRLGAPIKAATPIRVDDILHVPTDLCTRVIKVNSLIHRRVAAPIATTCYSDLTDPAILIAAKDAHARKSENRHPGEGRPTKLERREIDRLRNAIHSLGYPPSDS